MGRRREQWRKQQKHFASHWDAWGRAQTQATAPCPWCGSVDGRRIYANGSRLAKRLKRKGQVRIVNLETYSVREWVTVTKTVCAHPGHHENHEPEGMGMHHE